MSDMPTPSKDRLPLVEQCTQRLRRAVLDGTYPPETRLPSERTLSEQLGLNRVTVRSAMTHLVAGGLLEARVGSGYWVKDFRRFGGLDLLPVLVEFEDPVPLARDLLAIRRQLAAMVLEQVRAVADEAGSEFEKADRLYYLEDAIAHLATLVDEGATRAELADADLEVIARLVEITGSRALQLCFNPLARVVHDFPALRDALYAEPSKNLVAYKALLRWIQGATDADPAALLKAMAARDRATVTALERSQKRMSGRTSPKRPS